MVRMAEIEIKKCGVKFDPPAIVVIYGDKGASKTRRRTMPLHDFDKKSNIDKAVENLHSNPKHGKYVSQISKAQLTRLVTIIRDKLNGMSLEASLARNDDLDKIDPEQNLNAVDEETLQRKKVVMDQTFVKHQLKPGDPGFEYDVQVEFDEEQVIESGWDSGDGSDFEF
ncbi:centrosomal protein of 19 kDa-like [Mya arenaria]|uniref:centrosomal protein of 19 kDa-like n=1 Tax=Mya arenaria TaxID=6604 RepID=UPI0022E5DA63|nr:centrosomal protein of 19 kDa-like [Mya arenaria]XP_052785099.1 centrosomal protein of 19 kDa-like [Mya arenaria]